MLEPGPAIFACQFDHIVAATFVLMPDLGELTLVFPIVRPDEGNFILLPSAAFAMIIAMQGIAAPLDGTQVQYAFGGEVILFLDPVCGARFACPVNRSGFRALLGRMTRREAVVTHGRAVSDAVRHGYTPEDEAIVAESFALGQKVMGEPGTDAGIHPPLALVGDMIAAPAGGADLHAHTHDVVFLATIDTTRGNLFSTPLRGGL